jgi:hypothetical protein
MSLTFPQRSRRRTALAAAAMACLPLAGCSSGGADGSGQGEGSSGEVDTRRVSAVGISFEVPDGWEELDAAEVAEGAGENETIGDIADSLGVTPDQFEQMMASIDLFLFSDEGAKQGVLDNVNVLQIPGRMPNDEQLKLQFLQFGADVLDVSHEETDLGDTAVVVYEAEFSGVAVQGEGIYVDVGDGPVAVTVSASERETTDEISEGILDTLAEAS